MVNTKDSSGYKLQLVSNNTENSIDFSDFSCIEPDTFYLVPEQIVTKDTMQNSWKLVYKVEKPQPIIIHVNKVEEKMPGLLKLLKQGKEGKGFSEELKNQILICILGKTHMDYSRATEKQKIALKKNALENLRDLLKIPVTKESSVKRKVRKENGGEEMEEINGERKPKEVDVPVQRFNSEITTDTILWLAKLFSENAEVWEYVERGIAEDMNNAEFNESNYLNFFVVLKNMQAAYVDMNQGTSVAEEKVKIQKIKNYLGEFINKIHDKLNIYDEDIKPINKIFCEKGIEVKVFPGREETPCESFKKVIKGDVNQSVEKFFQQFPAIKPLEEQREESYKKTCDNIKLSLENFKQLLEKMLDETDKKNKFTVSAYKKLKYLFQTLLSLLSPIGKKNTSEHAQAARLNKFLETLQEFMSQNLFDGPESKTKSKNKLDVEIAINGLGVPLEAKYAMNNAYHHIQKQFIYNVADALVVQVKERIDTEKRRNIPRTPEEQCLQNIFEKCCSVYDSLKQALIDRATFAGGVADLVLGKNKMGDPTILKEAFLNKKFSEEGVKVAVVMAKKISKLVQNEEEEYEKQKPLRLSNFILNTIKDMNNENGDNYKYKEMIGKLLADQKQLEEFISYIKALTSDKKEDMPNFITLDKDNNEKWSHIIASITKQAKDFVPSQESKKNSAIKELVQHEVEKEMQNPQLHVFDDRWDNPLISRLEKHLLKVFTTIANPQQKPQDKLQAVKKMFSELSLENTEKKKGLAKLVFKDDASKVIDKNFEKQQTDLHNYNIDFDSFKIRVNSDLHQLKEKQQNKVILK